MATPINPDPNRRLSDEELERRRKLEGMDVRRGWYGRRGPWFVWWWIWLMIIVIAFFWFAGWGWWGYGGWWWGRQGVIYPVTTGSGVAVLNSNNRAAYAGQPFDLRAARVQHQVSNNVLWIGNGRSQPMLLVVKPSPGITVPSISAGDLVAASGTVQKAPPAAQAENEWRLDNTGLQRLEHQQAYLESGYLAKLQRQQINGNPGYGGSAANTQAANSQPR